MTEDEMYGAIFLQRNTNKYLYTCGYIQPEYHDFEKEIFHEF